MIALKWKQQHGQLAEALDIDPLRLKTIETVAGHYLRKEIPLIELINIIKDICITDEEWTAFVFSLGFTDAISKEEIYV